jgi:predicted dehydrogenase
MAEFLRYGMVGGDLKAFIGEVHRKAINFDTRAKLVAGSFSIDPNLAKETAEAYGVDPSRSYSDYKEMAEKESAREDGIDWVSICTPNFLHYAIAKEFLLHNINVVCEKPLCFTVEEAEELVRIAKERDLVFAVTYTYTGYTMVKVAREMIQKGELGKLVSVNVEYAQDWLIDSLDPENQKATSLSVWRSDPKYSGISNCIGDIGTHAENLVHYLTGQEIKRMVATTDTYGMALDLNANMILEYESGLKAALWCSQVACAHLNGLVIRVFGEKGALEWRQEHPDYLEVTRKGCAPELWARGAGYTMKYEAGKGSRIPVGHPEGLYIAFANIYRNVITTILKKKAGLVPTEADMDFQNAENGADGVKFIHKAIESAKEGKWVNY